MIIDRLVTKIRDLSAPIVVGLDPRPEQIPSHIKDETFAREGRTPRAVAEAFLLFNKGIIDQIYDIVPAVKPQIAMYEQLGPIGIDAYFRTIRYAKEKGLIVIGDIKRGDIASTAEAYSTAHIGKLNIEGTDAANPEYSSADFITINPYMGFDSISPYIDDCKNHDKGLFILVKTSNPGSRDVQDVVTEGGKPVYAHVGALVSEWGKDFVGEWGYSMIGAVVGATHPEESAELRKAMPHTFFLVPGYGAQGGSGKDLEGIWDGDKYGAIVNSSRGITGAYQTKKFGAPDKDFALSARAAVIDMKTDLGGFIK